MMRFFSASRRRRLLRRPLLWVSAAVAIVAALVWWGLPWVVALPDSLQNPRSVSVKFVTEDGLPLRLLLDGDGQWSGPELALDEMPRALIDATLAAEDQRFFGHGGVDLIAIVRAAKDNAFAGRIVSGASTVHQQLVKISAPRRERNLTTKLVEALQARQLAMRMPKETILAQYLNRVSYGNLFVGCAAACQGYFSKPLADLTAAEAAFLAALPQAPGRLNPYRNPEPVHERQQDILRRMRSLGWLDDEDFKIARAQPIVLQRFVGGFDAPHAVDWLRRSGKVSGEEIRTTLDSRLQSEIERMVSRRLASLVDHHATQAAVVVIENATGKVRAWVGSRDFFSDQGGQIDGAWTPRSPGSALKPFTYALAFERGDTPATMVPDLPIEFPTPTGIYRPENYDLRFFGPMTYRSALGNSLNVAAVRVLDRAGGEEALKTRLEELGLTTLAKPAEHYGLGLTIGNAPVRLVELTNAYATLARLGRWKPWTLLASAAESGTEDRQVIDPSAAWMIADILSDNQARELTFGRFSPLRFDFSVAVKTGTSSEYRDNWTLGYTPEFSVGVWMGNFDRTPMNQVSGVTGAATILHEIVGYLHDLHGTTWFARPDQMVLARIDPRTGHRLTHQSPPARLSREEYLPQDRLPTTATKADYDSSGRALLGPEFAEWIRSRDNWLGDLVAIDASRSPHAGLEIVNPISGTTIQLDPDLPSGGSRLILQTRLSGDVRWSSDTLEIEHDGGAWIAHLAAGRHRLTVLDIHTGARATTEITVLPDGAER